MSYSGPPEFPLDSLAIRRPNLRGRTADVFFRKPPCLPFESGQIPDDLIT
jgi:hypothetical protein